MSDHIPARSFLYVPGDRPELFPKAVRSGADVLLLDLEDAVDPANKDTARTEVAGWLGRRREDSDVADFVRINADPAAAAADLSAIVCGGLSGVALPKIEAVEQIRRVDSILSYEEHLRGLPQGSISIMVIIETAAAVWDARALAAAVPRVRYVVGGAAAGGDLQRSVGYEWRIAGAERLLVNSAVVVGGRAAGAVEPLYCGWMNVRDLEGLEQDASWARALGYAGALVIHPSHVPVVNEVFTPSEARLQELRDMVAAFEAAAAEGRGVIEHNGEMVDVAMARTARRMVERFGQGSVTHE